MFERVRRLVGLAATHSFFECRRCGTTVDCDTATCPVCGSSEIASYDVS
jgi:rubrerythrin